MSTVDILKSDRFKNRVDLLIRYGADDDEVIEQVLQVMQLIAATTKYETAVECLGDIGEDTKRLYSTCMEKYEKFMDGGKV